MSFREAQGMLKFKIGIIFRSIVFVWLMASPLFPNISYCSELLMNQGFEEELANWSKSWWPTYAGTGTYSSKARTGNYGLYSYTDKFTSDRSFSATNQRITPIQGMSFGGLVFKASGWIRTYKWNGDSKASIKLELLRNNSLVAAYESPSITYGNSEWILTSISTAEAPEGTDEIRFTCLVEKPSNGISGESQASFDDLSIAIVEPPVIESFSPTDSSILIKPGNEISFNITASSLVGPVNIEWQLNNSPTAIGNQYIFTGGVPGISTVKAVISDSNSSINKEWHVLTKGCNPPPALS